LHRDYPHIPILSEEGEEDVPEEAEYCWVVDPLDGTKEFIKRNGEFTVNIALVHRRKPVLGVIAVPLTGIVYFASKGSGRLNRMRKA
jgi:3'(2'), 5'-bisphosphate nucleotidase